MLPSTAAHWMLEMLYRDGCVYQDDVVDMLTKANAETLLRENADGNLVLGNEVLSAFKKISVEAVWIKPDRYWRWRVNEDEPGREQRG
ncbi:hypothetical protein QZM68_31060 [Burkholderia gladioli]|uniref:DUF6953 family protein n=1 Tax=Burkholderia gladioli TaxID=28095 RepID=UPI002654A3A0|nr:hypothetical protein [Burkholderia gladioli]MDN7604210.1 hypothetical protein [Burkholderia gladioli]